MCRDRLVLSRDTALEAVRPGDEGFDEADALAGRVVQELALLVEERARVQDREFWPARRGALDVDEDLHRPMRDQNGAIWSRAEAVLLALVWASLRAYINCGANVPQCMAGEGERKRISVLGASRP